MFTGKLVRCNLYESLEYRKKKKKTNRNGNKEKENELTPEEEKTEIFFLNYSEQRKNENGEIK